MISLLFSLWNSISVLQIRERWPFVLNKVPSLSTESLHSKFCLFVREVSTGHFHLQDSQIILVNSHTVVGFGNRHLFTGSENNHLVAGSENMTWFCRSLVGVHEGWPVSPCLPVMAPIYPFHVPLLSTSLYSQLHSKGSLLFCIKHSTIKLSLTHALSYEPKF